MSAVTARRARRAAHAARTKGLGPEIVWRTQVHDYMRSPTGERMSEDLERRIDRLGAEPIPVSTFAEFWPTSATEVRPQEAPKLRRWKRRIHDGHRRGVLVCRTTTGRVFTLTLPAVTPVGAVSDPDAVAGPSVSQPHRGVYLLHGARVDVDAT